MTGYILLGVLAVLVVYGVILFNNLVKLKYSVSKAWANIDVLLKQRHDELPKLVETCKQYMTYEQDTLERVLQARAAVHTAREQGDVGALGAAEGQLRLGLGNLFALAEDYPELKANEGFRRLQRRITDLENGIADRRELYNDAVSLNNTRIEQAPDIVIARLFGFGSARFLEFSREETRDVDMKLLFG